MALLGLYYNYDQEGIFVPGINNKDVVPQFDTYGESKNIVRQGVNETFNSFYHLNAAYNNVFDDVHGVDLRLGGQIISNSFETDMGVGRNTANDSLSNPGRCAVGRFFSGYGAKWSWLNAYLQAAYILQRFVPCSCKRLHRRCLFDGCQYDRMGVFLGFRHMMLANFDFIKSAEAVNRLNLYADYGKTATAVSPILTAAIITSAVCIRALRYCVIMCPTPKSNGRKPQSQLGIDMALWRHRVQIKLGYYNNRATDVLMAGSNRHFTVQVFIMSTMQPSMPMVSILSLNVTRLHQKFQMDSGWQYHAVEQQGDLAG